MKRIILLVLIVSTYSISFSKSDTLIQTIGLHYTVKMSYRNIATSDSDLKSVINSQSGYKFADDIGLMYQVILPSKIGLRAGVRYSNKGFAIDNYNDFGFSALEGEKYKVGFHVLSIPLQISYHRIHNGKKYHFYPFLEIAYETLLFVTKKTSNFNIPKQSISPNNDLFKDFMVHNLSAAFGMGWLFNINPEWMIGFRAYFTTDILPVYDKNLWDTRLDASAISLEVNYRIGKSKKGK